MVGKFLSSGVFFNHERVAVEKPRVPRDTKAFTLVGRVHEISLERLLRDREEARSLFVKSTEGLDVSVSRVARFRDGRTGTTPKAGVDADVGGARRRRSLRARDGGERVNRALRDARATGSWLAPQGQLAA